MYVKVIVYPYLIILKSFTYTKIFPSLTEVLE